MEHFGKYTLEEVTGVMHLLLIIFKITTIPCFILMPHHLGISFPTVEEQDEVIQHPGSINTLGEVLGRADAVQMNIVLSSQMLAFY